MFCGIICTSDIYKQCYVDSVSVAEMSGQLAFDIDSDGTVSREEAKVPREHWRKITITHI